LDTTGTFDVVRMHQIILSRLHASPTSENVNVNAETLLDRIKIVRVFDFYGLSEAINEIRDGLLTDPQPKGAVSVQQAVIPDSEDEDEDLDLEYEQEQDRGPQKVGCVVVDNLTTTMNPLFKTNHVQGM